MTEETPAPPATLTFALTGWGWAEARLQAGDLSLDFEISYLWAIEALPQGRVLITVTSTEEASTGTRGRSAEHSFRQSA